MPRVRAGFEIVDLTQLDGAACPCGTSRRAFAATDSPCSVHLVEVKRDSQTHYHKRLTETYYFLSGRGHIELDGELFPVKPGLAVRIPPGVRHRAVPGKGPMKMLNIVVPPFDPRDEWFD